MSHQTGLGRGQKYGKDTASWDNNGPFRTDMDSAMDQNAPQQTPEVTGWYGDNPGDRPSSWANRPAQYDTWYSAGGIGHDGSAQGSAHKFSCSKCHSPHATGLPVLLITNCIDATMSNWVGRAGATPTGTRATNCHRKTTNADGWHRLQPGE